MKDSTISILFTLAISLAINPCYGQQSSRKSLSTAPGNITVQKTGVSNARISPATGALEKFSLSSAARSNAGTKSNSAKVAIKKLPDGFQSKSTSTSSALAGGNLTPYKPSEWDNIIVLSAEQGTYTSSPTIYNNQNLYVDFAFANVGESDISETFFIDLYIDGELASSYYVEGLSSGYYVAVDDDEFWPLSSESHTFRVVADSDADVSETDEEDNEYSRSKTFSYDEPCVNTVFYQTSDWDDLIILSTVSGTSVSSPSFNSSQSIYVDLAFANTGGCGISQDFDARIYVDDIPVDTMVREGMDSHIVLTLFDREIGPLTAGSHTIKIVLDAGHVVNEFDETDNEYSQTIQVSQVSACINVLPYQPAGWDNKLVLSTTAGTNSTNPSIIDTQDIFLDWAVINNGNCAISKSSKVKVFVDDVLESTFTLASLGSGIFVTITDIEIGKLPSGTHIVKVVADADGELTETNEGDNEYAVEVNIVASVCANLIPFQPDGWDNIIVLSTVMETGTSATVFRSNETIYVDLALLNSGSCDIADTFFMGIYIDNVLKESIYVDGLLTDYYGYITDLDYGKLSAGVHTFKLVADDGNAIPESSESDNVYSRTITVVPVTGLSEPDEAAKISVFPNPFRDLLVIEMKDNRNRMDYEIINSVGQTVTAGHFTERTAVSVSDLKPGFYLIRLNDGNTIYLKKVIRE